MLVNGRWTDDRHAVQVTDAKGGFVRPASGFRHWVTPDGHPGPTGEGGFPAEAGRYHLHVALSCPWVSRTLLARKLKRLEDVVSVSVVEPAITDRGWRLGAGPAAEGAAPAGTTHLHELYAAADPAYTGRATVPVLWDKRRGTIVSNKSADIVRMPNSAFVGLADDAVDLCPEDLRPAIDQLNDVMYRRLDNGVYRAGFATSQEAYEEAVRDVFGMLDELECRLRDGRAYLFGARLTETDVRLFVTLVRFDAAYHGLFKCNLRRLADYPGLSAHLGRLLAVPGVAETVDLDHIKRGYYSIRALNPTGIVPLGPTEPLPGMAAPTRSAATAPSA